MIGGIVAGGILVLVVILAVRLLGGASRGRTFRGPGAGATGAIYDMLNEDKRKAIEIIVEGRAEHRDPETADDMPPDPDPDREPPDSQKL